MDVLESLNFDQRKAVIFLYEQLKTEKVVTLAGYPGTGKTYCTGKLIRYLEHKWGRNINVLAATIAHEAKENLRSEVDDPRTLASITGLTLKFGDDDNPFDYKFEAKDNFDSKDLRRADLVIIDECSLLGQKDIDLILSMMSFDAKLILLGDDLQISNIGSKGDEVSPSFLYPMITLTHPVRQDPDSNIYWFTSLLRDIMRGNKSIEELKDIPRLKYDYGEGFVFTSRDKAIKSFVNNYRKGLDVRACAYRNKTANTLNIDIRKELWGNDCDEIVEGELLISKSRFNPKGVLKNTKKGIKYLQWEEAILNNGALFKVKSVKSKFLKGIYKSDIEDEMFKDEIMKTLDAGIEVWSVTSDRHKGVINIVKDKDRQRYNRVVYLLERYAYSEDAIGIKIKFTSKFCNVKYGYLSSIFSLQGKTHHSVYVDYSDVNACKPLTLMGKMRALNVAASRPTNNLCLFS